MNLLHDIAPGTKEKMNVIVETNKHSKNKYEIDKETGLISLDRVLPSAQDYPVEYGFVPQTLSDDGDALDVIMLVTYPLRPGVLVAARPIGLFDMTDSGEPDAKIFAVPIGDPRFARVLEVSDVNHHTLKEIEHFFETYKQLQKKEVVVHGFKDKAAAEALFEKSCVLYKKTKK